MLSLALAALLTAAAPLDDQKSPPFPQYPSLSPDGAHVVFSSAGDLWATPTAGGMATRLTVHPALELRSAFSPDGSVLAFQSDRGGSLDLYVSDVGRTGAGLVLGPPRRVTWGDRPKTLSGFSADGASLLFTSSHEPEAYRGNHVYRVPVEGGPITRLFDAFGDLARAVPDGSGYVYVRGRGTASRPGYRGSGTSSLWRYDTATGVHAPLVPSRGSDGEPFMTPDGSLVFLSTRDGQNDLFVAAPGAEPRAVLAPRASGRELTLAHGLRDLAVSADGSTAVVALWDDLVRVDLASGDARTIDVDAHGALERDPEFVMDLSREVEQAALSPDGKTMAVIARGEVFVRPVAEGRPTRRVTHGADRERGLAWAPDGSALYFTSDHDGGHTLWRATVATTRDDLAPKDEPVEAESAPEGDGAAAGDGDEPGDDEAGPSDDDADAEGGSDEAADETETEEKDEKEPEGPDHGARWEGVLETTVEAVYTSPHSLDDPRISPDGKRLALVEERGDLVLIDLADDSARTLSEHWSAPSFRWAADSRHLVSSTDDLDFNEDVHWIDVDADGAAPVNITRHPDLDVGPALSADGKVLAWLSDRAGTNFEYDVFTLILDRDLDAMQPWERDEHFEKAAKAVKWPKPDAEVAPFEPDLDESWLRARRLTSLAGSERNVFVSAGGDRVYFTGSVGEESGLWSVDHDGKDREKIMSGSVSDLRLSADGKRFSFVQNGQAAHVEAKKGGKVETVSIDARVRIPVAAEQSQKFREATHVLGENFYHPTLKDLDWEGLRRRYGALASSTRTSQAFNRVVGLMFGELDGSHLGISGGRSGFDGPGERTGYLGLELDPVPGGYEVTRVTPGMPAGEGSRALAPGDRITAVDGVAVAEAGAPPAQDWRVHLRGTQGGEVLLDVVRADGAEERLVLRPVGWSTWNTLRYEDTVRERRAEVERLSGGRLGYLHIRGMSMSYVRDFERDLYAAAHGRDGLVIDVRDNGGGSTTDILLASLTAPNHAYTVPRGADDAEVPRDAYPRDRRLIYGYSRPITVLMNENSFSNAEIFSHSIKTIGRGKLVGEATFGGVISTGGTTLIDGSWVRLPFRGWYLPDGTDMESHGAEPDVPVARLPGDEDAGFDAQLAKAVEVLLAEIDG